jgi:hypothetical protein
MSPFSIQADLSNADPWDPTKTFEDLPVGIFDVKTTEVEEYQKPGGKRSLHFVFEVTSTGPAKGKRGDIYIGLDFEAGQGVNKRKLITSLNSHGAKAERIKAAGANLNVTEAHFLGKPAIVYVREANAEATARAKADGRARALNDKEFIRPEDRAELLKALEAVSAPAAPAPAGAPATAQPPAKADDLFA